MLVGGSEFSSQFVYLLQVLKYLLKYLAVNIKYVNSLIAASLLIWLLFAMLHGIIVCKTLAWNQNL